MAEAKAGKATAYLEMVRCCQCQSEMYARLDYVNRDDEARTYFYQHPKVGVCFNAGKRFKVKTVELEECL